MKKNRDAEKKMLHYQFLMDTLKAYEEFCRLDCEMAVWMLTPELERENLNAADACVKQHFEDGTPIPLNITNFLRFAVDAYISSPKFKEDTRWGGDMEKAREYADMVITDIGGVNTHQKPKFDTSVHMFVDVSYIIEDIQALMAAADDDMPREKISSTAECLAELLQSCLTKKDGSNCAVKPSASTIVAPGCQAGIICFDDGSDIPCGAWKPVSAAMAGGCLQCPDNCPYRSDRLEEPCQPEYGRYLLFNGVMYDTRVSDFGENVFNALSEAYEAYADKAD